MTTSKWFALDAKLLTAGFPNVIVMILPDNGRLKWQVEVQTAMCHAGILTTSGNNWESSELLAKQTR